VLAFAPSYKIVSANSTQEASHHIYFNVTATILLKKCFNARMPLLMDLPLWPSGSCTPPPYAVESNALSDRGSTRPGRVRLPKNYF